MKKLICTSLFTYFLSFNAAAFVPNTSWVIGEMAQRCGANSHTELPGAYGSLGKINSTNKHSIYFLGEFINCSGASEEENVAAFTKYLNLLGVTIDEISLGFFANQIVYIIGKPDGVRLLVDKETLLPLQQISGDTEATFTNWDNISENKKMFPSKISIKTGVSESHFDFVPKTEDTGKNDAGIFK